ncbi:hypothetical protein MJ1HA_1295 [Metallosphaera sedula]|nr:hypothetical protein MJ1HA_1295 [Metallosphaera sedula]
MREKEPSLTYKSPTRKGTCIGTASGQVLSDEGSRDHV